MLEKVQYLVETMNEIWCLLLKNVWGVKLQCVCVRFLKRNSHLSNKTWRSCLFELMFTLAGHRWPFAFPLCHYLVVVLQLTRTNSLEFLHKYFKRKGTSKNKNTYHLPRTWNGPSNETIAGTQHRQPSLCSKYILRKWFPFVIIITVIVYSAKLRQMEIRRNKSSLFSEFSLRRTMHKSRVDTQR